MSTPRVLACLCVRVCLGLPALCPLAQAQTPPTAYTIVQAGAYSGKGSLTYYRNGGKVVQEIISPAQEGNPASHLLTLYDLKAGVTYTWDPTASPVNCNIGRFSGDWGDPFGMTSDLEKSIASGDIKAAGTEVVAGISTSIYTGTMQGTALKAWLDAKDGLVLRAEMSAPGGPPQPLVNITGFTVGAPPAQLFTLPSACAGLHPDPTPAEVIANETGDSADNYVNANFGPGSKDSCNILVRVVQAKTMTPITRRMQFAIDTSYDQDHPPHYDFGLGQDGVETFSGGGIHEITNQAHDGTVLIKNPPAYFMFSINLVKPGAGQSLGLIYRQCFHPTTVLLYVVKDPDNPSAGTASLYAKSGKYATVP